MLSIGCTGGIGAGKSTVAALLSERGAVVLDADAYAREALEPGSPGLEQVVSRFGPEVLDRAGNLERGALAAIVFHDDAARRDLEAIVHPVVEERITAGLEAERGSDAVVVVDVALLIERDGRRRYGLDGVLVVDADEEHCLERLARSRGMSEADARARMAAQVDRMERIRRADFVIMNIGNLEELDAMVAGAWSWIHQLRAELRR